MHLIAADSIVLRQRDFKERDRLVTFLTRDAGKLTGIARGVKKLTARGVGAYEPFTRCVMHYAEKSTSELVHIRKCDMRPPYPYLSGDYDAFLYCTYFTELVDMGTVPNQATPEQFELLDALLVRVATPPLPPWAVLRAGFELDWLRAAGLAPEWRRCVECGAPIYTRGAEGLTLRRALPHRFDVRAGGVRCPDCAAPGPGRHVLAPGTLADLAAWRQTRDESNPVPRPHALGELETCLEAHLTYHLERRPRSLDLLPGRSRNPAPPPGAPGQKGGEDTPDPAEAAK